MNLANRSARHTRAALLAVSAICFASTAGATVEECQLGELTRTVEVVYSTPGQPVPCEVLYAKASQGTLETLWRASTEAGYCESKAAELVAKLENLGWQCAADAAADAEAEGATAPGE